MTPIMVREMVMRTRKKLIQLVQLNQSNHCLFWMFFVEMSCVQVQQIRKKKWKLKLLFKDSHACQMEVWKGEWVASGKWPSQLFHKLGFFQFTIMEITFQWRLILIGIISYTQINYMAWLALLLCIKSDWEQAKMGWYQEGMKNLQKYRYALLTTNYFVLRCNEKWMNNN